MMLNLIGFLFAVAGIGLFAAGCLAAGIGAIFKHLKLKEYIGVIFGIGFLGFGFIFAGAFFAIIGVGP